MGECSMLTDNQRKQAYIDLIDALRGCPVPENMRVIAPVWDDERAVRGYPSRLEIGLLYKDSDKSNATLMFHIDDAGTWDTMEIESLDIEWRLRNRNRGSALIDMAIVLAKKAGVSLVHGRCLERDGYSSAGFYEKCGFEIRRDGSMPPAFRMEL